MTLGTDSLKVNLELVENTLKIDHTDKEHCTVSQKAKVGGKSVTITLNFDHNITDEQAKQAMTANLQKAAIIALAFQLGEKNEKEQITRSLTLFKDNHLSRTFTKLNSPQEETEIHNAKDVRTKLTETRKKTQFVANQILRPEPPLSKNTPVQVQVELEKTQKVEKLSKKEIKEKFGLKLKNFIKMAQNERGFSNSLKSGRLWKNDKNIELEAISSLDFKKMSLPDLEEKFNRTKQLIEEGYKNLNIQMPFEISAYYRFMEKHLEELRKFQ